MNRSYGRFRSKLQLGSLSLRRRFVLYVVSAIVIPVMLSLVLLSLLGVLNPTAAHIDDYLDIQLDSHILQIEHNIDRLAAYALFLSEELGQVIDTYLNEHELTFDELTNNIDALTDLQEAAYNTTYTHIRMTPCSGAFYILNTTVNDSLTPPRHNGIYIKFANLYTESTVNTKIALFRGFFKVARNHDINLCSTWQNEMRTDVFDDLSIFSDKEYAVSRVTKIPDTWERARYIYAPVYGEDRQIIGICGFEMSDLYLQLIFNTADTESEQTVCALLDPTDNGYIGQFISNRSGYMPPVFESIRAKEHGSFIEYQCDEYKYIGKSKVLDSIGIPITVAMMFPKEQFEDIIRNGQFRNIAIFFLIATVATFLCLWLSKKYIMPISKGITQIKTGKTDYTPSGITEIDDLFAFLAEQDRINEEEFDRLRREKADAIVKAGELQSKFDETSKQNERLAYSRKDEIDPYDYENFKNGLAMLTSKEKEVFDFYMQGKNVKEIMAALSLQESTVRFHNKNIYSKLGVHSLKQLLRYAAVLKQEEGQLSMH